MTLVDVRCLPTDTRLQVADKIRVLPDFDLPDLSWFNTAPCPAHSTLEHGQAQIPPCRQCGIRFRKHQRVGVAWLYMRGHGLIADQVGTGKTAQAAGLIAAMKQIGELDKARMVVVVRPSALPQWVKELRRFLPKLLITAATGTRAERVAGYCARWDVMVIGYQMLVRDQDIFGQFPIAGLVVDDVDPLRNAATQTSYAVNQLAQRSPRVVILNGTPLQKRLQELHSVLAPLGGLSVFGSATSFRRRYVREEFVRVYNPRAGRMVTTRNVVGYQRLDEFVAKVTPMTLRRTPAHIDDVELPVILPHNVHLDLYPAQTKRYDECRRGVVQIIKDEGVLVKQAKAASILLYAAKICAGLNTLGETDGPGMSSKLDWVEQAIVDGDLSDEKVVVFAHFTDTVAALMARLTAARVGHAVIWGRDNRPASRAAAVARFWDDPTCRVFIGTEAIEQSLNLQVSRHLINIDQLMNPARMQQLAGRIRRDGSAWRSVYVHSLLTNATHEEDLLDTLAREQALADHVWGESNQLYEALSPLALLQLVGRSGRHRG